MPRKFEYYDRVRRPKLEYPAMTGEYVDYEVKQVIKKTGDGEDDFEIEEKVIEHKTNIKEFIESFAKDVGVEAIMKKIALTGDTSLLNQVPERHADLSIIPEDPEQAFALSNAVQEAYSKIDPELTGGLSIEDFVASLSEEKLGAYIDKKVAATLAKKEGEDK